MDWDFDPDGPFEQRHFDFGSQHCFIQTQRYQPTKVLPLPLEPWVSSDPKLHFEVA